MNEGKNNEDFATYKVNDYHFMLFGACDGQSLILLRLQGVCKGFVHLGLHLRGWLRLPQIKVDFRPSGRNFHKISEFFKWFPQKNIIFVI